MGSLKDKKASVPVSILVLGTFVVCGLALLSFSLFSADIKEGFYSVDYMEQMNTKISKYNLYFEQGIPEEKIHEALNESGFHFKKDGFEINETERVFSWGKVTSFQGFTKERLVISIRYYTN